MKTKLFIPALLLMILFANCKKDRHPTVFSKPNWSEASAATFPYSMSAVIKIPSDISTQLNSSDILGAFVDNECRALGSQVKVNGEASFFVLIHGSASEESKVTFKFFDSKQGYMYVSLSAIDFVQDGSYGSADKPVELRLVQL